MSAYKIQATKNYRLFTRSADNRETDIGKHSKLKVSMQKYGFIRAFPLVCHKNESGQLVIKDGQHRLAVAEELGLTVYWVQEEIDFDIALVNCTAKVWQLRDYAATFANKGLKSYQQAIDFAAINRVPLGTAVALLSGVTTFSAVQEKFSCGEFVVKDLAWAEKVASVYVPLTNLSPTIKSSRMIEACMAVCRVKEFAPQRLVAGAEKLRDKLVPYTTRDAYLDLFETLYNYYHKQLFGLKAAALMAMKERNVTKKKKAS